MTCPRAMVVSGEKLMVVDKMKELGQVLERRYLAVRTRGDPRDIVCRGTQGLVVGHGNVHDWELAT